jgi:hypothetical protein
MQALLIIVSLALLSALPTPLIPTAFNFDNIGSIYYYQDEITSTFSFPFVFYPAVSNLDWKTLNFSIITDWNIIQTFSGTIDAIGKVMNIQVPFNKAQGLVKLNMTYKGVIYSREFTARFKRVDIKPIAPKTMSLYHFENGNEITGSYDNTNNGNDNLEIKVTALSNTCSDKTTITVDYNQTIISANVIEGIKYGQVFSYPAKSCPTSTMKRVNLGDLVYKDTLPGCENNQVYFYNGYIVDVFNGLKKSACGWDKLGQDCKLTCIHPDNNGGSEWIIVLVILIVVVAGIVGGVIYYKKRQGYVTIIR